MFNAFDLRTNAETKVYGMFRSVSGKLSFVVYNENGWDGVECTNFVPTDVAEEMIKANKVYHLKEKGEFALEFNSKDNYSDITEAIIQSYEGNASSMAADNLSILRIGQYMNRVNSLEVDEEIEIGDSFKIVRVQ